MITVQTYETHSVLNEVTFRLAQQTTERKKINRTSEHAGAISKLISGIFVETSFGGEQKELYQIKESA